jgi:hypothetical protein
MTEFRSLPLIVRLATIVTPFLAWLLFAELVIDRHGLDRFLPLYRVGNVCAWDVAVVLACAVGWWRLHRR